MQHYAVPDRHVIPENQRAFIPHDVTNGSVLNVGVFADADDIDVAADHTVVPDAGMVSDFDVAHNLRALSDIDPLAELRPLSLVLVQHYLSSSCIFFRLRPVGLALRLKASPYRARASPPDK